MKPTMRSVFAIAILLCIDAQAACLQTTSCDMTAGNCEAMFQAVLIEGMAGDHQVDVVLHCGAGVCGAGTANVAFKRAGEADSYHCISVTSVDSGTCLLDPWASLNAAIFVATIATGSSGGSQVTDEVTTVTDCFAAISVNVPQSPEPPDTDILSGPAEGSSTSTVAATFTFTSFPPGAAFEVQMDGGAWTSIGTMTSFATPTLSQGAHTFAVRAVDGNLTDATAAQRSWTIVAPPSPRLYFANTPDRRAGPQTMSYASIGAGGTLTLAPSAVATAGDAAQSQADTALAASPDGSLLFLGHNMSNLVQSFVVAGTGKPAACFTIPVTQPASIAVHPTLSAFYVVDLDRPASRVWTVWYFPDGSMTTLGPSDLVADEARGIAVHPSGSHLVTSHIFGAFTGVEVYSIGANGALTFVSSQTITGGRVNDVAFDRGGNFLYVADLDQGIYAFRFGGGALTPLNGGSPYSTGMFLYDFVVSPTEDLLFTISATPAGALVEPTEVRRFAIAPDGTLTQLWQGNLPDVCTNVTMSRDGRTLMMSSRTQSQIRSFAITPGTLPLSEAAGSPYAVPNPESVTPSTMVAID